ncbi:MAG: hypothetical protein ACRC9U_03405 [Metamycoplasmataceae bacterium]
MSKICKGNCYEEISISSNKYIEVNSFENISKHLMLEISDETDEILLQQNIVDISKKINEIKDEINIVEKYRLISEPYAIKTYNEIHDLNQHKLTLISTAESFKINSDKSQTQGIDALFHCSTCKKIHILEIKFTEKNNSANLSNLSSQLDSRINDISTLKNNLTQLLTKKNQQLSNKRIIFYINKINENDYKKHVVLSGFLISQKYFKIKKQINHNLLFTHIKDNDD